MDRDDQRAIARLRALQAEIARRESRLVNPAAMGDGGEGGGDGIAQARRINDHARADGELDRLRAQERRLRGDLGHLARRASTWQRVRAALAGPA